MAKQIFEMSTSDGGSETCSFAKSEVEKLSVGQLYHFRNYMLQYFVVFDKAFMKKLEQNTRGLDDLTKRFKPEEDSADE